MCQVRENKVGQDRTTVEKTQEKEPRKIVSDTCIQCNRKVNLDHHFLAIKMAFDQDLVHDKNQLLQAVHSGRRLKFAVHRQCVDVTGLIFEPLCCLIDVRAWRGGLAEAEKIVKDQIQEQLG